MFIQVHVPFQIERRITMKKSGFLSLFGGAAVLFILNLAAASAVADPAIYTGQSFSRPGGSVCICADADRDCAPCGNIVALE
jgi:hypothetical protein